MSLHKGNVLTIIASNDRHVEVFDHKLNGGPKVQEIKKPLEVEETLTTRK